MTRSSLSCYNLGYNEVLNSNDSLLSPFSYLNLDSGGSLYWTLMSGMKVVKGSILGWLVCLDLSVLKLASA